MIHKDKIFDELLIIQYQAGNKKAMSLLVNRWHKKLCRHSYWYTGDLDVAKDIVQDCWGVILRKIPYLKNPASFGSWAMSVVTRRSIDWIRRNNREINNKADYYQQRNNHINDNDHSHYADPIILVKTLIKDLPEHQKIVLKLFYLEQFSIQQISEALQLAPGTVKSRLFHAREKLRTTLTNKNHEK